MRLTHPLEKTTTGKTPPLRLTHHHIALEERARFISNYIRLLQLHPIIQAGLRDFIITIGHAKPLLSLSNQNKQLELYNYIVSNSSSVREIENIIKESKDLHYLKNKKTTSKLSSNLFSLQENLAELLESNVKIKSLKNGKKKVEILFISEKKLYEFIENIKL